MIYLLQSFNQSLETGVDLTTYTTISMKYRKPDGVEGEWTPVVVLPAVDGVISYEIPVGILDVVGRWEVWSHIVNDNGTFPGHPVYLEVAEEGVSITNKDFVKSYLGITVDTTDGKIEALIPMYEALYLKIRNAPWSQGYTAENGELYNQYPPGSNVTISEMIGYKLSMGSSYDTLTSERIGSYNWTSDGKTSFGFPAGVIGQITRFVRGV